MVSECTVFSMKSVGLASIVTNSLESLSALDIATPEDILSRTFTCDEIQSLHLCDPAISGASQDRQQMENPICSIARLGNDILGRKHTLAMNPTNN